MSAVGAEPQAPQLSGVAEAVHTWSGQGEALLVLTQHGALLERPGRDERWSRLGRYVTGDEAQAIADRKGYDHVGFDSKVGEYVPPGVLLALVPPPTDRTEGDAMAAAAGSQGATDVQVTPVARMTKPELNAAVAERNKTLAKVATRDPDAIDAAVAEWARRHAVPVSTVRSGLVKYLHERKRRTPWEDREDAEQARMGQLYRQMYERVQAGERVEHVGNELAAQVGRKPGGFIQTYRMWLQGKGTAAAGPPPGAAPAPPATPITTHPAVAAMVQKAEKPEQPAAQVRALLGGVQAVQNDGSDAVAQVRETLDSMGDALQVTWRAIPTARKIIEGEIEQLMARLDELEAEAKRVQQVAELLGVELQA